MKLLISEVLQKVSNAKTKVEKVKLLQQYNSDTLRMLLIWNFDESISSAVPEGEVPYTVNDAPAGTEHTSLEHESRLFFHFIKGGNENLTKAKRENMFIQLLEGLHKDEANVLCMVKDKKLGKRYKVTKAAVAEAFPQINWGGRSQ
tara:strand:- start:66 stop:503 length:438 start_codon:yes stop_codon:yes gene_type:complete